MQRLLFSIVICFSLPVFAQTQEAIPAKHPSNAGTSNAANNHLSSPVFSPAADTTEAEHTAPEGKLNRTEPKAAKKGAYSKIEENREMELKEKPAAPAADTQAPVTLQMREQFELNQRNSTHQYSRRSASPAEQLNMDQSVRYYRNVVPGSFEAHFYAYLAGRYDVSLYPELAAAAAIQPENTEVKKQEAAYFIILADTPGALGKIRELVDAEIISPGQLSYANDLLVSGQENATIITHGFDDMLSAYYIQNQLGVRPDVQLVSLDLLQSVYYRAANAAKGLVLPETSVIDTAYLAELCDLNPNRTLQLSLTIPRDYFSGMKAKLYPVGLTLQYSETVVDNYSRNRALWDSEMKKELVHGPMHDSGDKWSSNYLLMMITLRKQLIGLNELKKAELLNKAILELGARNNATKQVIKYTE